MRDRLLIPKVLFVIVAVWCWASWIAAVSEQRVTASVSPRVVMFGGTVRVTCRVPRDADNRGITLGIADYASSYGQLDGAAAAITHGATFTHVPCSAGSAFCRLDDAHGNIITSTAVLAVAGCN